MFYRRQRRTNPALRQEGHVYRLGSDEPPALRQEGHVLINRLRFCKANHTLPSCRRAEHPDARSINMALLTEGRDTQCEVLCTTAPADEHTALRQEGHVYRRQRRANPALRQEGHVSIHQ